MCSHVEPRLDARMLEYKEETERNGADDGRDGRQDKRQVRRLDVMRTVWNHGEWVEMRKEKPGFL